MTYCKEVGEMLKKFMELYLTPVGITRSGGGEWVLMDMNTKRQVETFSDYGAMVNFLKMVGATDIAEDKLNQPNVSMEVPCEQEKLDYYWEPTKLSAIS